MFNPASSRCARRALQAQVVGRKTDEGFVLGGPRRLDDDVFVEYGPQAVLVVFDGLFQSFT